MLLRFSGQLITVGERIVVLATIGLTHLQEKLHMIAAYAPLMGSVSQQVHDCVITIQGLFDN